MNRFLTYAFLNPRTCFVLEPRARRVFYRGMQTRQLFTIAPAVPEKLRFPETLARNLWWSWNTNATELFRRINRELWKETRQPVNTHSPVYAPDDCIACFCAAFGVHESLPLFADSLGALGT